MGEDVVVSEEVEVEGVVVGVEEHLGEAPHYQMPSHPRRVHEVMAAQANREARVVMLGMSSRYDCTYVMCLRVLSIYLRANVVIAFVFVCVAQ